MTLTGYGPRFAAASTSLQVPGVMLIRTRPVVVAWRPPGWCL